jgi:hypothetical protein
LAEERALGYRYLSRGVRMAIGEIRLGHKSILDVNNTSKQILTFSITSHNEIFAVSKM